MAIWMEITSKSFLLCLLLAYVYCNRALYEKLDKDCPGPIDGNLLRDGMFYSYRYNGVAESAAVGTSDQVTKLNISCDVRIQAVAAKCAFEMRLGCKLSALGGSPNDEKYWMKDKDLSSVNKEAVVFTLNDGKVGSILSHPREPLFSLNIKRGIISAFAVSRNALDNGEKDKKHIDVHGVCPWEVKPLGGGRAVSTKDMLNCAVPSRLNWHLSPYSMFWNMSFIQYLINSSSVCNYETNGQNLKSIDCHERHAILLESSHQTAVAVQTNIRYKLDLVRTGTLMDHVFLLESLTRFTDITFEYDENRTPDSEPPDFTKRAQKYLSDLVFTSEEEIQLFSIKFFHEFVALLRAGKNLLPFVETVSTCGFSTDGRPCEDSIRDLGLSYAADALVQCNTLQCMKAFTYLVTREHVPSSYLNFALYSWTNIHGMDPEYVSEILKICKKVKLKTCWLTLGSVINTCTNEHKHSHGVVSTGIQDSVNYITSIIGKNCDIKEAVFDSNLDDNKKHDYMLLMLKTIGNIGDAATMANEDMVQKLYDCSQNQHLPNQLKVSAIEAMNKMESNDFMYHILTNVLQNQSESVELRIAAYDILVGHFGHQEFVSELVNIVRTDAVSQVKGYIASHLQQVLVARDSYENPELAKNLEILLERLNFNLYSIQTDPSRTSHRTLRRMHGINWDSEVVFNTLSAIPETLRSNLSVQLVDELVNFMELGFKNGGWDRVIVRSAAVLSNVQKPNILQYIALIMQQIAGKPLRKNTPQPVLLDRKMEENIQKLQQLYDDTHKFLKPYFVAYIKMFGNELDFSTLEDVMSVLRKQMQQVTSAQRNPQTTNKITANSTHILRIIEAYHQFPTLMGIPLNWTTNATLAFSVRAGFQLEVEGKYIQEQILKAHMFLQPSAALTFVNRMVVDIPTITQIGVQANSSAYTSTQWELDIKRLPSGVVTLSLKVPEKQQKPLQLFRTNQFIKGDLYEDIPDWDVSRVYNNWCLSQKFTKDTGLDVCVDMSYVNVTHQIKPWFLMCGWAKWSLTADKTDRNLQAYNVDVSFGSVDKSNKELKLHFTAPGTTLQRDIPLLLKANMQTGEVALDIRHSDDPNFEFNLSRTKLLDGEKHAGYRSSLQLKDQGKEFYLEYSKENRVELREPSEKNKTPTGKKTQALVDEREVQLKTPDNYYRCKSKVHLHDGSVKADVHLTYEILNPNEKWLKKVLPAIAWENDRKATLEFRGNWRAPSIRGKETWARQTTTYLGVPASFIELSTHAVHKHRHKLVYANLTQIQKASGKLLTFANFTYNSRQKEGPKGFKEIRIYNLTIPRNSWAFEVHREKNELQRSYVMTLQRSSMVEKETSDSMFVGWWHPSHSHRFEHKDWKSVLKVELHRDPSGRLPVEFHAAVPSERNSDVQKGNTVHADLEFLYPYKGKEQKVRFNGSFVWLENRDGGFYSFQKDFRLSSSRFKLQMDSHSAALQYGRGKVMLVHKSSLINTESGSAQGVYRLGIQGNLGSSCPTLDIRHNISAHWLDFSSNATITCKPTRRAYLINVDNFAHVPTWSLLDSELHQVYDFDVPGSESMNFTSGIMDINVVGKWSRAHFMKKALFQSKTDLLPSSEWQLTTEKAREIVLDITSADGPLTHIVVHTQVDWQWKEFGATVKVTRKDSEDEDQDLSIKVRLLGPNDALLLLNVSENHRPVVREWLRKTVRTISKKLKEIAYDPKHEINFYFQPETTLGESFEQIKQQVYADYSEVKKDVRKNAEAFSTIYGPIVELLYNLNRELMREAHRADVYFRRTIPGWAFYYFGVSRYSYHYLTHIPHNIADRSNRLTLHIHHPLYWERFMQKPALSKSTWMGHLLKENPIGNEKQAMIFGTSSVLTFDGLLYKFPAYPEPNCAYLLAHDLRGKTFSAVTTSTTQYLIFPSVAVTLDGSGEVYINTSKTPQPLPYQSFNGAVSVSRDGNKIAVKSAGLDVVCDMSQFCIYKLASLFHGGTIGLLGNGDGEVYNDFIAPDGRLLSNATTMGQVYDVSGRVTCQLLQDPRPLHVNSDVTTECSRNEGSLHNCFKTAQLSEKTQADLCNLLFVREEMCTTINSLSQYCTHYGPSQRQCTKCRPPESTNQLSMWQQAAVYQLEVVLLVDQHHTMFGGDGKQLKGIQSFVNDLSEHFQSNGYSSVSYSLVGFGGNGVRSSPSVHTLDSKLWYQSKDIPDLLNTLSFQGSDRGNGLQALKFATTIEPSEPVASKVFVFFTVNDKMWHTPKDVHDTSHLVEEIGVTLYTVASYPELEKGKKVFGLRADGFMFPQRGGEAYLDFPTTPYAKVTSATRGSIFLRNFVEENTNAFFFNEFAEEVGAKVGKEAKGCRSCKCSPGIKCKPSECK